MTTAERYAKLSKMDRGTSFLANVIFTGATNRAKKLKNLLALVEAGISVQCCQFDMFMIRIDGDVFPMSELDNPQESLDRIRQRGGIK